MQKFSNWHAQKNEETLDPASPRYLNKYLVGDFRSTDLALYINRSRMWLLGGKRLIAHDAIRYAQIAMRYLLRQR